jgi:hypothetical protein
MPPHGRRFQEVQVFRRLVFDDSIKGTLAKLPV